MSGETSGGESGERYDTHTTIKCAFIVYSNLEPTDKADYSFVSRRLRYSEGSWGRRSSDHSFRALLFDRYFVSAVESKYLGVIVLGRAQAPETIQVLDNTPFSGMHGPLGSLR